MTAKTGIQAILAITLWAICWFSSMESAIAVGSGICAAIATLFVIFE
jgi:hypothetical protein